MPMPSGEAPTPPPPGADASDQAVAALVERRGRIRQWWTGDGPWDAARDKATPVGLALSGGGIRSATFSLGLIQALAKTPRDALARVDILSTVSGGGYIGCFLRSMFVPTALRGIERPPTEPDPSAVAEQYRFARRALGSGPHEQRLRDGPADAGREVRNPLWWLREHSRFLAPTGPSDYGIALAYIARNWLAMVYIFMLACAAIGALVIGVEAAVLAVVRQQFHRGWAWPTISPVLVLLPLLLAVAGVLNIAYWATQAMSTNERQGVRQRRSLDRGVRAIFLAAAAALATTLATAWGTGYVDAGDFGQRLSGIFEPELTVVLVAGQLLGLVGAVAGWAAGRRFAKRGALLTAELRLWLTVALAEVNRVILIVAVVALVDTLAAQVGEMRVAGEWAGAPVMLPALAFLIKKLPDWFGGTGKSGTIGPLLHRFADVVALVAGLLLYGALAVLAVALVHHVAWANDIPWDVPHWPGLVALGLILLVLTYVSGQATGFINLSSLHALYGSKLTRAYLGASNRERLVLVDQARRPTRGGTHPDPDQEEAKRVHPHPITENHATDYIQPQIYGATDLPAPIHIINVTLNETIDARSQIVTRDRKGELLSLEPEGIRIGNRATAWSRLTNHPPVAGKYHAEGISLGQWCAISGAAASSAMGRMSKLGFALAFTFANIRLGYWWWAPDACEHLPRATGIKGWAGRHLGTFVYLFNEMTCRYSLGYERKYLTDGGHYENSGALVLIRRRVPLILVSDNGADPGYAFEDMQVLIRQVRIDLGGETEILGGRALDDQLASLGAHDRGIFVDPVGDPDWQVRMLDAHQRPFVLVLRVTLGHERVHLLWIKPRLLPGLPADVAGYAALAGAFPQQPTGDQFFDEAQWESYRRLGEESMNRLLDACPRLLAG